MIKKIQIKNDAFYEFNQDDLAVYPAHGVGKINGIENRSINGEPIVFYIMQILESSMIIMIPIRNAKTIGLRPVIDKDTEIIWIKLKPGLFMESRRFLANFTL